MDGLRHRRGYYDDPAAWIAYTGLLRETFGLELPSLPGLIDEADGCEGFAWFDLAGTCVANVSLRAMPLAIAGRLVPAVGVQSVAVRPPWRGRGLFRGLMHEALAACDAQRRLPVLLYASQPEFDRPFGVTAAPAPALAWHLRRSAMGLASFLLSPDRSLLSRRDRRP